MTIILSDPAVSLELHSHFKDSLVWALLLAQKDLPSFCMTLPLLISPFCPTASVSPYISLQTFCLDNTIATMSRSYSMEEMGKRAWKTASRAAKHMSKHSKIVNPSMEKCIPRFERDEVILGEMLGSGGFNDVYEVERIDLIEDLSMAENAKKISSPLQAEHRAFVAKHVFRESSQNCRYGIKFLSVETIEDPSRFCTGAADLVVVRYQTESCCY